MTIGKRIYWVVALVALLILAGVAVAATSRLTSAQPGPTLTADASGQQAEADDASESATKGPDLDTVVEQSGDQNVADDASESATKGPDTDTVEEQSGDQQ
jgi:hypothetical protein